MELSKVMPRVPEMLFNVRKISIFIIKHGSIMPRRRPLCNDIVIGHEA